MSYALELEKLYARRGSFWLKDIHIQLAEGQIHAVAGSSGSGKSTLIRAIGGALRPEAGCIRYDGIEMYENEREIRKNMSVVYDSPNFNMELKPDRLIKELQKFEPWFDRQKYEEWMRQLQLDAGIRIKLYSEGQQRKLMLILALCRKPKLLVMDEITSGVDRASREVMWELVSEYCRKEAASVLFTTHHEEEMKMADHVWYMDNGQIRHGDKGAEG